MTKSGLQIPCFMYVMCDDTGISLPSKPYLDTMVSGATEHHLPNDYIKYLEQMNHNGYDGIVIPPWNSTKPVIPLWLYLWN